MFLGRLDGDLFDAKRKENVVPYRILISLFALKDEFDRRQRRDENLPNVPLGVFTTGRVSGLGMLMEGISKFNDSSLSSRIVKWMPLARPRPIRKRTRECILRETIIESEKQFRSVS